MRPLATLILVNGRSPICSGLLHTFQLLASSNSQVYQLCSNAMFDSLEAALCCSDKMMTLSFTFASEQGLNSAVQQSIAVGKCTCNVRYVPVSHVYLTVW